MAARLVAALAAGLVATCVGARARAEPITRNDFAIDAFQGPILAPLRMTALGGAYAGYAEGISGFGSNAASPSVREAGSSTFFEAEPALSLSWPLSLFENNDFDNSGRPDDDYYNFLYGTLGLQLQAGPFGFGFSSDLQRYTLYLAQGGTSNVSLARSHLLLSWGFLGGQLHVGAGVRMAAMLFETQGKAGVDLGMIGASPEVGLLVRPDWQPFRVGATFRGPVETSGLEGVATVGADGVRRAGALVLPTGVVVPWELEVGFALQVGPRPLNPRWIEPRAHDASYREAALSRADGRRLERLAVLSKARTPEVRERALAALAESDRREARRTEREVAEALRAAQHERRSRQRNWPRAHLLLLADLVITGSVSRGVSVSCFLGQARPSPAPAPEQQLCAVGSSGPELNFSPRFGIEAEPVPDVLKTRFGSYYEPGRFATARPVGRQHFTFGAELKAVRTDLFGLLPRPLTYTLQTSFDVAPRYESFSLGIGVWK